ncbi:hypothetical protein [Clostridium sp. JS66]|uniref:hypothetical protein n=1 Tax=Clostridium sp. JS66 TaxID=3064705 RepID=UPI00298DA2AB|nr:hypothetical protein [Clostridium sp. JS66]WPC42851.1 hypothetical protein Q6H37_05100 [Clostridium sp. JS66]
MILNENNIIYAQDGVDNEELLKPDQAIIYRSPSKIKFMGYAGDSDRIAESSTIDPIYFKALSKMRAKISLGSTGTAENKKYKNVHLYYEEAKYLDGIDRIGYLYQDGDKLKLSEYKKGSRGSRYSSLYPILESKLKSKGFEYDSGSFEINTDNIESFVNIINEICEEKKSEKYCLIKSNKTDKVKNRVFNMAYWDYKDNVTNNIKEKSISKSNVCSYKYSIIGEIEQCSNLDELINIENELESILNYCKSKMDIIKILNKK